MTNNRKARNRGVLFLIRFRNRWEAVLPAFTVTVRIRGDARSELSPMRAVDTAAMSSIPGPAMSSIPGPAMSSIPASTSSPTAGAAGDLSPLSGR